MKLRVLTVLLVLFVGTTSASLPPPSNTTQERKSPVAMGAVAPDFTLEDQHGRKITLSESRGKNPVVLVFYRGYW